MAEIPPKYIFFDYKNKVDVSLVGNTATLWIMSVGVADVTTYRIEVSTTVRTYGIGDIQDVLMKILGKFNLVYSYFETR